MPRNGTRHPEHPEHPEHPGHPGHHRHPGHPGHEEKIQLKRHSTNGSELEEHVKNIMEHFEAIEKQR